MDRLQKKCLIVSAGIHLLMMCILLVGPAFVPTKPPPADTPILDFIPDKLVDADVTGGGNPNARRPAPAPELPKPAPVVQPQPKPQPPQPEPAQPKQPDPEPPKDLIKNNITDPDAVDTPRKPRKPNISLKETLRKPSATAKPRPADNTAAQEQEQLLADQRRIAHQLKGAANSVREGTASATAIEDSYGPGGGGPSYASYVAWVKTVYENAWRPPDETTMEDAIVKASITIARDGTILAARITIPCGESRVDRSVRDVLDRVRTIGKPFPEGAREAERTYTISFNLKAKRGLA
jgi:TonB family protein